MEARTDAVAVPGEQVFAARLPADAPGWIVTSDGLWLPRHCLLERLDLHQREPPPGQAERDLFILERALRMYRADLEKREEKPYLTSRDVHQRVVVAKTSERMCRYVELPGVHDGFDSSTGVNYVGRARYFFSYSWDSPWHDVVAALAAHTQKVVAAGEPPPYYWIDIFAVNQHLAIPPWRCTNGLGDQCPGCAAVQADMHDWNAPASQPAKGFERVISKTRHTLVFMEPWRDPRPPQRVWCLFEGYQTLAHDGELEVILGPEQQLDLRLTLATHFTTVSQNVNSIDARLAEATMEEDRTKIFGAIERLDAGFDGLNEAMRRAQRQWLASAAEDCLQRTDPTRNALDASAMAAESVALGGIGAAISQFLEAWPRFPILMWALWNLFYAVVGYYLVPLCYVLLLSGNQQKLETAIETAPVLSASFWRGSDETVLSGVLELEEKVGGVYLLYLVLKLSFIALSGHQFDRQLRMPPPLGAWTIQKAVTGEEGSSWGATDTQAELWTTQLRHFATVLAYILPYFILRCLYQIQPISSIVSCGPNCVILDDHDHGKIMILDGQRYSHVENGYECEMYGYGCAELCIGWKFFNGYWCPDASPASQIDQVNHDDHIMTTLWQFFLLVVAWMVVSLFANLVLYPMHVAGDRASVAEKLSFLRLELGDAKRAEEVLTSAHAESQGVCGASDAEYSCVVAPWLARNLLENGQAEAAEALRRRVDLVASSHTGWRRHLRIKKTWFVVRMPRCCHACDWLLAWLSWLYLIPVLIMYGIVATPFLAVRWLWTKAVRRCHPCRRCWRSCKRCCRWSCTPRGTLIDVVRAFHGAEYVGSRSYWWRQRGPLLRARMAAAVRAPDTEVLALLTEAGSTKWGSQQVLDREPHGRHPELVEFLERMADGGAASAEERAVYNALPPTMRSSGGNPNSQWIKLTCNNRHSDSLPLLAPTTRFYYRRIDNTKITSLDAPAEGVRQQAEFTSDGKLVPDPVQQPQSLRELFHETVFRGPFDAKAWESAYADLGGPGCWTTRRNEAYKRKQKAKRCCKGCVVYGSGGGMAVYLLGLLVLLVCVGIESSELPHVCNEFLG